VSFWTTVRLQLPDFGPVAVFHPLSVTSKRSAYLAWLVVCLVWGTTYLCIRVALETMPPLLMAGARWVLAGAIILIGLKIRGERIPKPGAWWSLTLLGILLIGFGNGAVVWAEQTVPSGLTAVLVAAVPFWMVGVERFMPNAERVSIRRLVGLLVGFGGILLLVWPELGVDARKGFVGGVVATQLACAGWAIGSSYSRRRGTEENVLAAASLEMLFGGLALLLAGALRNEWANLAITPRTGTALAYLIVAGSVAGFSAYAYALKHLPVAIVSVYAYVNPMIAVLLGTLILGESLSPRLAVAGAIVLVGMALVKE
jgi:drug/metabolite transporter (DMT)-like permease